MEINEKNNLIEAHENKLKYLSTNPIIKYIKIKTNSDDDFVNLDSLTEKIT